MAQYQRELRTGLTRLLRSSATPAAGLDPTEALGQAHAAERDLRHGVEDLLRSSTPELQPIDRNPPMKTNKRPR